MIKRISGRLRQQVNYALLATGKASSRSVKRSFQSNRTAQSKKDEDFEKVDSNLNTPSSPTTTNTEQDHDEDHDHNKRDDDKDERLSLDSFLNCEIDENFFRKYGNGSATAYRTTSSSPKTHRRNVGRPKRNASISETVTVSNTSSTPNNRSEISPSTPESLLSRRSPRKRMRSSLLRQYDIDNGGQMINMSGIVRRPRKTIFSEITVRGVHSPRQNSALKKVEKGTTVLRAKVKVDEIIRPKIRLLQKSFLTDSTDLKAYTSVLKSRKRRRRIENDNCSSRDNGNIDNEIATSPNNESDKHPGNNSANSLTINNNTSSSSNNENNECESSSGTATESENSKGSKVSLRQKDHYESLSTGNDKIIRKNLPKRHLKLPLSLSSEEFDLGRNIAIPQLLLKAKSANGRYERVKNWNSTTYSKRLRKRPQSGYYRSLMAPTRRAPNHQKRNESS